MPRVFTLNFTHNHQTFTAVVSQLQTSVSVYLPDTSLHTVLPHGRFCFNADQGLNLADTQGGAMQQLLLDVLTAIQSQPQTQPSSHA